MSAVAWSALLGSALCGRRIRCAVLLVNGFASDSTPWFQGETMLLLKGIGSINSGIGHPLYVRYRYQLCDDAVDRLLESERSHFVKALSGLNVPLLFRRA